MHAISWSPPLLPADPDVDVQELLILTALFEHPDLVIDLVGPDFRSVVGGRPRGACCTTRAWAGNAGLVRKLLERGADAKVDSGSGTPLAWAAHGSGAWELEARDYVAVAGALVHAGNPIEARLLPAADGPLYEWLAGRAETGA